MSFTQSYIIEDEMCECPACGEYCLLDEDEIAHFNLGDSVPITCYECNTIFYLEKEN